MFIVLSLQYLQLLLIPLKLLFPHTTNERFFKKNNEKVVQYVRRLWKLLYVRTYVRTYVRSGS